MQIELTTEEAALLQQALHCAMWYHPLYKQAHRTFADKVEAAKREEQEQINK